MINQITGIYRSIINYLSNIEIPIGSAFEKILDILEKYAGNIFDFIADVIDILVTNIEAGLLILPAIVIIAVFTSIAYYVGNIKISLFTFLSMFLINGMNLWPQTMTTLAMILTAVIISLGLGIPIGILAAKKDSCHFVIKPLLDFMQTMPPFVYLIPAVIFFGMGTVPGVIATVIFSMPPAIRLTNLGIRQVDKEVLEAAKSFGSTPFQILYKVQLPLALPTIMAGINQTIMLALSMVVIASMIGGGGLGEVVLRGITQLEIGLGFEGGLGVVFLAIILDRITQSIKEN